CLPSWPALFFAGLLFTGRELCFRKVSPGRFTSSLCFCPLQSSSQPKFGNTRSSLRSQWPRLTCWNGLWQETVQHQCYFPVHLCGSPSVRIFLRSCSRLRLGFTRFGE